MYDIRNLNYNLIRPGNNDRTRFDRAALQELADNIRENGLAQPITVRPVYACGECEAEAGEAPEQCPECGGEFLPAPAFYQIVAGERRFRAIGLLAWETVPAIVRDLADEEASAIMLAENVARQDLDPIDEGRAYMARMEQFGWAEDQVAERAGVSVIRVRFRTKLLRLRDDVQALVRSGDLQIGYAQILADAGLDTNRQLMAITRLRDNPRPTPGWFRHEVNQLLEEQAQVSLFDLPLISGNVASAMPPAQAPEPPHPATTIPPKKGATTREVIDHQVSFWQQAAEGWDRLGKPFKRQECQAAAQALQLALVTI